MRSTQPQYKEAMLLPMRQANLLYKKARAEAEEREVIAKKQTKENWR